MLEFIRGEVIMSQLPLSGPLSIEEIADEFYGAGIDPDANPPHWLADYYGVDDDPAIPTSGTISISDFYGTSNTWTIDLGTILLENNIKNLNIHDFAIIHGWNGRSLIDLTIPPGIYIWSDDILMPAMITGDLPNGLILRNMGYIIGKGGAGGSVFPGGMYPYIEAENGGPAFELNCECELHTMTGYIAGGGGGGGGMNVNRTELEPIVGGGGGGAGGGRGGAAANVRHSEVFPGGEPGAVGEPGDHGTFHGLTGVPKGSAGPIDLIYSATAEAGGGGGTVAHDGINKSHDGHGAGYGGGRILPGSETLGMPGWLDDAAYYVHGGTGGGGMNDGGDAYSDTRPDNQVRSGGGGGGWGAKGGTGRSEYIVEEGGEGGLSIVLNNNIIEINGDTSRIWGAIE